MHLFKLIGFILLGLVIARVAGIHDLENASGYALAIACLLAIGLYASTFGIELKEARKHLRIILSAVTVGVVLKAVIIGGSLALIFQNPFFLILGVTVAQIDPLSVAGLLKGNRMSAKAKTILASWASFDDPITVILALYAPLLVMQLTGAELGSITGSSDTGVNLLAYIQELGLNLGFAGGILVLWLLIRYYSTKVWAWAAAGLAAAVYVLLFASLSVAAFYFMMLGIALIGLFLRPAKIERYIKHAITWALRTAAVLLGFLLIEGIDIWMGIALGVAAYCAQIVVGFLLTRKLPRKDRWHIAFAQQNGITAIILALLFEPIQPGTVAIVAPAIVVINGLHGIANKLVDKHVLA